MHSDTLKITFDSTESAKNLQAFTKAKFYRHDLQGACDSLIYSFSDSSIIMHNEPVLWSDQNQLTSDSIKIFITNNSMDSLVLYNNALIISKDDSVHFNQIKGRDVIAHFKNNELYQILVSGNSESVYYVRDDETKELIGINKGLSSTMKILIVDKEMREIIYYSEPKQVLYPENELAVSDRRLKGFKWLEEIRPHSKNEIFN